MPKLFGSHLIFVVAKVSRLMQNHRGPTIGDHEHDSYTPIPVIPVFFFKTTK